MTAFAAILARKIVAVDAAKGPVLPQELASSHLASARHAIWGCLVAATMTAQSISNVETTCLAVLLYHSEKENEPHR